MNNYSPPPSAHTVSNHHSVGPPSSPVSEEELLVQTSPPSGEMHRPSSPTANAPEHPLQHVSHSGEEAERLLLQSSTKPIRK